jgi:Flp pilus assembly protein TadG
MKRRGILSRLRKDKEGITIVEFAFVSPVLMLLVCGTMEICYDLYQRSVIQGVIQRAARKAAVGGLSSGQVDLYIKDKVKPVLPGSSRNDPNAISILKKSYYNFSNVNKKEKITRDINNNDVFDSTTDCYEDANRNGSYDQAAGAGQNGLGGADDIVYYEVSVTTPRLFPVVGMMGFSENVSITTKTVIRNQPFSVQNAPVEVCPPPPPKP